MPKRRILILTTESLPGLGLPTAGGGIRAHTLGESLRAAGHEVLYSIPESVVEKIRNPGDPEVTSLKKYAHRPVDPTPTVLQAMPDILIVEQWQPLSRLGKVDAPIVVDLPGPLVLENSFRKADSLHAAAGAKIRALQKADVFLYTNPRQKGYWLAWLTLAGAPLDRDYLLHVPICRSPDLPGIPTGEAGIRFIHGGVFWPWQDPELPLKTLIEVLNERAEGVLEIFGGRHPHHTTPGEVYRDLAEVLPASERVKYHDMLPLEELETDYRRGGVALELAAPNPERELSSTIRTIGFLWCGLPVVVNDYSYLAEDVERFGAGWVVPPDSPKRLRETFRKILDERDSWNEKGRAAQRLAKEKFVWPGATRSLLQYCEEPFRREKRQGYLTETREALDTLAVLLTKRDEQIRELHEKLRTKSEELEDAYRRLQARLRSRIARKLRRLLT
jgi:glycosyltransferase involved in cell wall biosynthesis